MTDRGNCSAEKEGKMDWMKELKDRAGVTDEGDITDLNDVEGREILTLQHLKRMNVENDMIRGSANMDVASGGSNI